MKSKAVAVLAVVVVVAALLLTGQFKNFANNASGGATGLTMIQFTVKYQDGTQETFPRSFPGFGILPLTISFQGKQISSIDLKALGKIDGGNLTNWQTTTALKIEVYGWTYDTTAQSPMLSSTVSYPASGPIWNNGETKQIAGYLMQGNQLDPLLQGLLPKPTPLTANVKYNIQVTASVSMTATVNGQQQSYSAPNVSGMLTIDYSYTQASTTPQITFSSTVQTVPLSIVP